MFYLTKEDQKDQFCFQLQISEKFYIESFFLFYQSHYHVNISLKTFLESY